MVNDIVAIGLTDSSTSLFPGISITKNELPTRMDAAVASGSVGSPYYFASIGHGGLGAIVHVNFCYAPS